MVGRRHRERTVVNAVAFAMPFARQRNPVEWGKRLATGNALARGDHLPARAELAQAAAARRPFVEIAEHHRRAGVVAAVDFAQDRADLMLAPQPREVEMR